MNKAHSPTKERRLNTKTQKGAFIIESGSFFCCFVPIPTLRDLRGGLLLKGFTESG